MIPTVEQLVQTHAEYIDGFPEETQNQFSALTSTINITTLLEIAGRALGSECVRFDKIYQGGFNQVFNLWFRDSSILALVRINMPWGGGSVVPLQQRIDRVNSEAATLKWIKENTSVPVPCVYAYNGDPENPVGAPYIIEERILGQPLAEVWYNMRVAQRCGLVKQLAHIQAESLNTSFPMIGSLYEDPEKSGSSRFYVGRNVPPVTLERERIDRGPWKSSREQMQSYLLEELEELQSDEAVVRARRKANLADHLPFDAKEFEELYIATSELVDHVELFDKWEPRYGIIHPDLSHTHNILVSYDDPSRIVGLIDWEGTRVQPWWKSPITADFLYEENDAPDKDDFDHLWVDACREWGNILKSHTPRDLWETAGPCLSNLERLACKNNASWNTIDKLIEGALEWRLDWPQLHDPAFTKLDNFLRKHRPGFQLEPPEDHVG